MFNESLFEGTYLKKEEEEASPTNIVDVGNEHTQFTLLSTVFNLDDTKEF